MKDIWKVLKIVIYILLLPIIIFVSLVIGFSSDTKSKNKVLKGLTKYEKEEVKKGRYRPDQFSEPEEGDYLDSDDYYFDE